MVIDLFVYRDISGSDRGLADKGNGNYAYIDSALEAVNEALDERGFSNHVLANLNGIAYKPKEDVNYFVSDDWKSTGAVYSHMELDQSTDSWKISANREFLIVLRDTARKINSKAKMNQKDGEQKIREKAVKDQKSPPIAFSDLDVPSDISENRNSEIVVIVLVSGYFQSIPKGGSFCRVGCGL